MEGFEEIRCTCGGEAEQLAETVQSDFCTWSIGRVVRYVCDACGLIWDVCAPTGGEDRRPR
jgi:hypothetical protein